MWFSSELAKVKLSCSTGAWTAWCSGFPLTLGFSDFSGATEKGFMNLQQEERAVCSLLYLLSTQSKPWSSTWKPPPQLWAPFFIIQIRSWFGCTQHCYCIINGPGQINQWPDPNKNTKYRDTRQHNNFKQITDLFNSLKNPFNNQVSIYSAPITHLSASCELFMNEVFCSMTFILTPQVELSTAVISALRN